LRSGDGGLALLEVGRQLAAGAFQHGLDVLAGAEGVGPVVGAGAGVVADLEAADGNLVLAAGGRVGDAVVGEDAVLAEVLDAELALAGALAADVDLLFAEHTGRSFRGAAYDPATAARAARKASRPGQTTAWRTSSSGRA